MPKRIEYQVVISAAVQEVWQAWTTEEGVKTFFAPDCKIDLRVGGAYEIYFNPDASPGERGGEGLTVLAVQPKKMFSFTWNAPPSLPEVRGQLTHVALYFQEAGRDRTIFTLAHDGWGSGGQWDQAFDYFTRAWGEVVLPRLEHRFQEGPLDWDNPPDLGKAN